jgi:hypothetical protein
MKTITVKLELGKQSVTRTLKVKDTVISTRDLKAYASSKYTSIVCNGGSVNVVPN